MSRRIGISLALLAFAASGSFVAIADEPFSNVRPYNGIQAGLDAHAVGEAQRVDAINRQLGWNELFRWQAATQRSSSIFYDPYVPGFDGFGSGGWWPGALDFRPGLIHQCTTDDNWNNGRYRASSGARTSRETAVVRDMMPYRRFEDRVGFARIGSARGLAISPRPGRGQLLA